MTRRFCFLLLILFGVAACASGAASDATPTPDFTPTLTPVSTALPEIAATVSAGLPANPIVMRVVPDDPIAASRLVRQLEEALLLATNVTIDIQIVDTSAEILEALCNSDDGYVNAAWVDGLTYAAAVGQNCGTAALQAQAGDERRLESGQAGVIVVNTGQIAAGNLAGLTANTFCRVGAGDAFSWIVPSLILRSEELDPLDIPQVDQYEDYTALLDAVLQGECAATGVPQAVWESYREQAQTALDNAQAIEMQTATAAVEAEPTATPDVTVTPLPTSTPVPDSLPLDVVATTLELPLRILVLPFETPLAARLGLIDGLEALEFGELTAALAVAAETTPEVAVTAEAEATAETERTAEAEATPELETVNLLEPFFGDVTFGVVEGDEFEELFDFLEATGLNFSRLGE